MQIMKIVVFTLLAITAATVSAGAQAPFDIHETELGRVKVEQILGGIDRPWGLAMLPDGSLLVTERGGAMYWVDPENPSLDRQIKGVPPVTARGQGGLLDVVVDPQFAKNRMIYFTFSEPGSGNTTGTALASARLPATGPPRLQGLKILYSMRKKTNSAIHFGSRIAIAPDGTLFVTVSDRGQRDRAQDPFDTAGSIIRKRRQHPAGQSIR